MLSKDELRARLITEMPEWVEFCENQAVIYILLDHSAFADMQAELLGVAIHFAAMSGKDVNVVADKGGIPAEEYWQGIRDGTIQLPELPPEVEAEEEHNDKEIDD